MGATSNASSESSFSSDRYAGGVSTPPPGVTPIPREASRIILLDEQDRVLLFRWEVPPDLTAEGSSGAGRMVWITPGGGLAPGETHVQAALRELWEETGLSGVKLEPCAWERRHTFRFKDRWIEQHELFFVARTAETVLDSANWTVDEQTWLREHRWWTAHEIDAAAGERFAPRALGSLLTHALRHGFPDALLRIEV